MRVKETVKTLHHFSLFSLSLPPLLSHSFLQISLTPTALEVMRAEKGLLFVGVLCCYNMPAGAKAATYVTVSDAMGEGDGLGKSGKEQRGRQLQER